MRLKCVNIQLKCKATVEALFIHYMFVLRKIVLRDKRYCLEASREFVVCLYLGLYVSVSKSVCFVIFL